MLAKKKSLIFCLFETWGGGGGGKNRIVSNIPKNERFFCYFWKKKIAHFFRFSRQRWGGGRQFFSCLEKTKYERFFFCKHPLKSFIANEIWRPMCRWGCYQLMSANKFFYDRGQFLQLWQEQGLHNLLDDTWERTYDINEKNSLRCI